MSKSEVLAQPIIPYSVRKANIERAALPANLGALLDEACAEAPDTVALDFFETGEQLTYRQLRDSVNRVANGMLACGIAKGTHVAVMVPNVAAFPITWLALARLGAVLVPINVAYTHRELEFALELSDAVWLIVEESYLPVVEEKTQLPAGLAGGRVIVLGQGGARYRTWQSLANNYSDDFRPPQPVGHDDLLNIQFTSGTTGLPKGAMLTQGYWLVSGKQNAFRDGRAYRRILATTPFFYMDPQWQLVMAFFHRATLFVAKRQSATRYMEWVRKYRINFGLLAEVVLKQPHHPQDADNEIIRVNVYGISKDLHRALEERFNLVAREAFGMTEIGTGLFMPIEANDMVGSGSCGIPTPFREARIMGENGRPAEPGVVGELQIRGRHIFKGYYKNPQATAAAFNGDWFRTGDLFRCDEQGYFTIVGRIKDMIRRAGENISAREVESVLVALPQVSEAAAVPVKDDVRGEEIKAYVVLKNDAHVDTATLSQIIAHCTHNLASFKVPRYFEFRESLPKTASGKIAKPRIVAEKPDLRQGSYDRITQSWL